MPYHRYSFQQVILFGNVGQNPEIRYTSNGNPVTNFSVATTTRHKDKDRTEWHNIVAWMQTAEFIEKYVGKGSKVFVEGRLQTSKWDDKNGRTHYKTEIIANQVQLIDGKKQSGSQTRPEDDPDYGSYDDSIDPDDMDTLPF